MKTEPDDPYNLQRFVEALGTPHSRPAIDGMHGTGEPRQRTLHQRYFQLPDYLKYRSCMTLFARAARNNEVFRASLERYFDGQEDPRTIELLGESSGGALRYSDDCLTATSRAP
jgi:uncharacterized protein (DUF1810 family)